MIGTILRPGDQGLVETRYKDSSAHEVGPVIELGVLFAVLWCVASYERKFLILHFNYQPSEGKKLFSHFDPF